MQDERSSPIYGYRKQPSLVDFPDRMAGVFFTAGCNFHCGFCHNLAELGSKRSGLTYGQLKSALENLRRQWVTSIVISGGEPTIWDDLPELVHFCRQAGFEIKLDTNGSHPDLLAELLPSLAYVAMDLKCSLDLYPEVAHWQDVDRIAESIELLKASNTPSEFRTTLLDGVHDTTELTAMGILIKGARRLVLQPFLPRLDLPDPALRLKPRTSPEALRQAADILRPYVQEVVVRGS